MTGLRGRVNPNISPIMSPVGDRRESLKPRTMQSLAVTAVARILISTSLCLGAGFSISRI